MPRYATRLTTTTAAVPRTRVDSAALCTGTSLRSRPGGSTKLYFTVAVDNSVTNPPPADGSILFSDATAYVFGGVTVANAVTVSSGNHLNLTIGGARTACQRAAR